MTPLPAPTRSSSDNSPAYAGVPTHSVEACSKGDVARASQHLSYAEALERAKQRRAIVTTKSPAHVKAAATKRQNIRDREVALALSMRPGLSLPAT